MQQTSDILNGLVSQYHLEIGNKRLWAPYWINIAEPPFRLRTPYAGKTWPDEFYLYINEHYSDFYDITPEELGDKLRADGVGVDCSGFVYFVLQGLCNELGLGSLADYINIPTSEVIDAQLLPRWKDYAYTEAQLRELGESIQLSDICSQFHKQPQYLTNVARLSSPSNSQVVANPSDYQPGDLIIMTGSDNSNHVAVITTISNSTIIMAHSLFTKDKSSGVRFETINLINPGLDLDQQSWPSSSYYSPKLGNKVVRPNALSTLGE